MPTQKLQALLAQLHDEVGQLDSSSMDEKTRLEELIDEIESNLNGEPAEKHASFVNSARARLGEFEVDHPTASGVARRLMQTLGDMGI